MTDTYTIRVADVNTKDEAMAAWNSSQATLGAHMKAANLLETHGLMHFVVSDGVWLPTSAGRAAGLKSASER